jgi:hypothetical protein
VRPPYGFSILISRFWRAFGGLKNEPTAEAFATAESYHTRSVRGAEPKASATSFKSRCGT